MEKKKLSEAYTTRGGTKEETVLQERSDRATLGTEGKQKNFGPKKRVGIDEFKKLLESRRANRIARDNAPNLYSYIYGPEAQDKKYSKEISLIENRLTDLGLHGKIHRLTRFKNIREIVEDDMRIGVKTLVVFGDDETAQKTLVACAGKGLTFGIVPFGEKNAIAKLFGVGERPEACQALSARLTRNIDLGKVNNQFFFSSLRLPHFEARIVCDNSFSISAYQDRDIDIFNLHVPKHEEDELHFVPNPHDGKLELMVRKLNKLSLFGGWKYMFERTGRDSLFFFREARIESREPVPMFLDGRKIAYENPKIEVVPAALKFIVGKNRLI